METEFIFNWLTRFINIKPYLKNKKSKTKILLEIKLKERGNKSKNNLHFLLRCRPWNP